MQFLSSLENDFETGSEVSRRQSDAALALEAARA